MQVCSQDKFRGECGCVHEKSAEVNASVFSRQCVSCARARVAVRHELALGMEELCLGLKRRRDCTGCSEPLVFIGQCLLFHIFLFRYILLALARVF